VGAMAKDDRFRVEKFNNQNYQLWKMHMEDYLYQKDLYQPFSGKTKKPMSMTDTKWDIIEIKALGTVRLCLAALIALNKISGLLLDIFTGFEHFLEEESTPIQLVAFNAMLRDQNCIQHALILRKVTHQLPCNNVVGELDFWGVEQIYAFSLSSSLSIILGVVVIIPYLLRSLGSCLECM